MTLVELVNFKLAVLTIISQIFIVLAVFYVIFFRKNQNSIGIFFSKYSLFFAFIVALVATVGSLFYSEIAGYEPCALCWYQRICMYPQVIILGMAIFYKEKIMSKYSILLSFMGAVIAGYHYLMQMGAVSSLPCPAVGYSVNCSQVFLMQFGYITLPLMAFTAFLLIIIFLLFPTLKKS